MKNEYIVSFYFYCEEHEIFRCSQNVTFPKLGSTHSTSSYFYKLLWYIFLIFFTPASKWQSTRKRKRLMSKSLWSRAYRILEPSGLNVTNCFLFFQILDHTMWHIVPHAQVRERSREKLYFGSSSYKDTTESRGTSFIGRLRKIYFQKFVSREFNLDSRIILSALV